MTATTALAYLQLQPNLRTGEQMTFHLIGECGRFGLWPFWTYTLYASLPYLTLPRGCRGGPDPSSRFFTGESGCKTTASLQTAVCYIPLCVKCYSLLCPFHMNFGP